MIDEEFEKLVLTTELTDQHRAEILELVRALPSDADSPVQAVIPAPPEKEDIRTQIANAELPEKMKLAMFGSGVARGLLIRDASKLVQQAVLKNPKLTSQEVEAFAKSPNVAEQVLRLIADSRVHMKSKEIKIALVWNPKTPIDIALKWMRYLQKPDLKELSRSRNVSNVISSSAKRLMGD